MLSCDDWLNSFPCKPISFVLRIIRQPIKSMSFLIEQIHFHSHFHPSPLKFSLKFLALYSNEKYFYLFVILYYLFITFSFIFKSKRINVIGEEGERG